MSYRYWQKLHPEWPKRLGDVNGGVVQLIRSIETRGGETFRKGTIMNVTSIHRGKLTLEMKSKASRWIRQVLPADVQILVLGPVIQGST